MNDLPLVPPSVPLLLQILRGNIMAQSLLAPGRVYTLPLNSVIKDSIPGGLVNEEHPSNLHGVGCLCRMAGVVAVLMRIPFSLLARLLRGSQCRHHRVQLCELRQAGHGQHWPCGRQRHDPLRGKSAPHLLVLTSCLSVI